MDTFMNKLEEVFLPIATKLGGNRYLTAIRDGFIAITPIMIAGSFFYLLNVVILGDDGLTMMLFNKSFSKLLQVGGAVIPATMSMMAVMLTFTVSKSLCEYYGEDTSILPSIAVVVLFVLMPIEFDDQKGIQYLDTFYTSAAAIFVSFLCSFGTIELVRLFSKVDAFIIKMPDSVPANVTRSFNKIIPITLTILVFALVRVVTNVYGTPLNNLIFELIQLPFGAFVTSPIGLIVIYFLYMLLWGFGIHTAFIFGPILTPVYLQNINANAEAVAAGMPMQNIFTQSFIDSFTQMGGAGNMFALIIAIFIVSNRADYKKIAKIGFVPALFNISEPIMFGLPVVMNPILIIPMILSTFAGIGIGAISTSIGFMSHTYIIVPSTVPPVLLPFVATGGNFGAIVTALIVVVVSVIIYMPFVRIMNKQKEVSNET